MPLPKTYGTNSAEGTGTTASVANGVTAVTGSAGTIWAAVAAADDYFRAQGLSVRIASVGGNGALTLVENWPGTTIVAGAYEIQIIGDGPERQLKARQIAEQLSAIEANSRGHFYKFATATADADPGSGYLRVNNAAIASSTGCYIDNLDANGADMSGEIDTWDDGTSPIKGKAWVRSVERPEVFYSFNVTSTVVDGAGYRKLTWSYAGGSGTLNADDKIMVYFASKGDAGQSGSAGITLIYDTATADADPGAGKFRLNHANPASATAAYIDNVEALASASITALLDSWDDSTSTNKGQVKFVNVADPTIFLICNVTGTVVDGTGYRKLTIANVTGANAFVNATQFSLSFIPKGDKGDTGATGGTGGTGAAGAAATIAVGTVTGLAAGATPTVVNSGSSSAAVFDFGLAAGAAGADGTGMFSRVRVVATSNVDIAGGGLANGTTHDGVVVATNDLALLTGQTAPAENGIYPVPASGAASRDTSFDTYDEHPGIYVSVMEGTLNADTLWRCTADKGGTLGTTALVFVQVPTSGAELKSAQGFPTTTTDNAIVRHDGTGGNQQGSPAAISDAGVMTGIVNINLGTNSVVAKDIGNGNPGFNFDDNDYIDYATAPNLFRMVIGGVPHLYLGATASDKINIRASASFTIVQAGNVVFEAASGMIVLNNQANGHVGCFLVGGGAVGLIGQVGTTFMAGGASAGFVSIAWSGSAYRIENNIGSTVTLGKFYAATRDAY